MIVGPNGRLMNLSGLQVLHTEGMPTSPDSAYLSAPAGFGAMRMPPPYSVAPTGGSVERPQPPLMQVNSPHVVGGMLPYDGEEPPKYEDIITDEVNEDIVIDLDPITSNEDEQLPTSQEAQENQVNTAY